MENTGTMAGPAWPEPPRPLNWGNGRTWGVFFSTALVLAILPVPLLIIAQIIWALLGLAGGFVPGMAFGAGLAVSIGAIIYPMIAKRLYGKADIVTEFSHLALVPGRVEPKWLALPLMAVWGLLYALAGVAMAFLTMQFLVGAGIGPYWGAVFGLCGIFSIPLARRTLELYAARSPATAG